MKDSFILYTKYSKHIQKLTMEQRGILFTAILMDAEDGELPEMDPVTDMVFGIIKEDIDRCNEAYEQRKRERSEKAKESANMRWHNDNANVCERIDQNANACERINRNANHANNVNDNDNVNDTVITKKEKQAKEKDDPNRAIEKAPVELQDTLREFLKHRHKIRSPMTEKAMEMLIKKTCELSGGDLNTSKQILEQSIVGGWKSVYPLKSNEGRASPTGNPFLDLLKEGEI